MPLDVRLISRQIPGFAPIDLAFQIREKRVDDDGFLHLLLQELDARSPRHLELRIRADALDILPDDELAEGALLRSCRRAEDRVLSRLAQ